MESKPTEEKASLDNSDNAKAEVRRSFASSEDYEDREEGKSRPISISDGESENYYAGIITYNAHKISLKLM